MIRVVVCVVLTFTLTFLAQFIVMQIFRYLDMLKYLGSLQLLDLLQVSLTEVVCSEACFTVGFEVPWDLPE